MQARFIPTGTVVLLVLGLVVGALSWWADARSGMVCAMFGFGLIVAGIQVALQEWRVERELQSTAHLHEATRLDELLLHRVSIAVPAAARAELAAAPQVPPGLAHRVLEQLEPHLAAGVLFGHVAEPIEGDPEGAIDRAAAALAEREWSDEVAGYRDEARARRTTAGDDGFVVVSALIVAHPTPRARRAVATLGDALALRDAILPITPAHTRAVRLVITPAVAATSFDHAALLDAFPELAPLSAERSVMAGELVLPQPVMRIELTQGTLAESIEAGLTALERELSITIPRSRRLARAIAQAELRLGDPSRAGKRSRRELFGLVVNVVNARLAGAGDPRRLAQVLRVGSERVPDARFVLLTPGERETLRRRGVATFAAWPRDLLAREALAGVTLVAVLELGGAALALDPRRAALAALALAVIHALRLWIRRRMVGIALMR